jgi:hypothetical protein
MTPTATDYTRTITKLANNLRVGLPMNWAEQVYEYLEKNFPEEIDNDGPRPFISKHAIQVACFHLGFEREDA